MSETETAEAVDPGPATFTEVEGERIAVRHRAPASAGAPTIAWLGGWRSDMLGSKAGALDALCERRGWGFLRHDYSGHGESGGTIEHGTISGWTRQSLGVLDAHAPDGPVVLAGSSMGAWIALRMVEAMRARGDAGRLAGLLLVAPAPDFVSELMDPALTDAEREALERDGRFLEHSEWSDEPNVWTRAFMEDGRQARVMDRPLAIGATVRIVQGTHDDEVPLAHAQKLLSLLSRDDAAISVVQGGDHRLSRPEDLALIERLATDLAGRHDSASA